MNSSRMETPALDWFNESTFREWVKAETRRQFFSRGKNALGWAALASLMSESSLRAGDDKAKDWHDETGWKAARPLLGEGAALPKLHFAPKAKNVI